MRQNRQVRQFERNCGWFQKVWNTYDDERSNHVSEYQEKLLISF